MENFQLKKEFFKEFKRVLICGKCFSLIKQEEPDETYVFYYLIPSNLFDLPEVDFIANSGLMSCGRISRTLFEEILKS